MSQCLPGLLLPACHLLLYPVGVRRGCRGGGAPGLKENVKRLLKNPWFAMRHAVAIGLWSFLLAAGSSLASQTAIQEITQLGISLVVLFFVILIGVLFDIIGVAVATAKEQPLHAMAARQVVGAHHALHLVRRAHQVASFCNDVVGDVSGTLSGAIGATIIMQLLQSNSETVQVLGSTLMTAIVAALVVGGKGYGKAFAIEDGTQIIFACGRFLAWVESRLHLRLFGRLQHVKTPSKAAGRKGRRRRPRA